MRTLNVNILTLDTVVLDTLWTLRTLDRDIRHT